MTRIKSAPLPSSHQMASFPQSPMRAQDHLIWILLAGADNILHPLSTATVANSTMARLYMNSHCDKQMQIPSPILYARGS